MVIKALPRAVVDRIAAGEVVERPASVVKELVENALDARSTQISVEIENGGLGLIRVSDDGTGISRDDLPLAFAAHATSKLTDVDDLQHIGSFGFRGEALASIAAVSHTRVASASGDDGEGWSLTCNAGVLGEPTPRPRARGTVVEVRDLFHNTPVRRRFLGAATTESARCREVVTALSLVHTGVRFEFSADGKRRYSSGTSEARIDRVEAVYGADFRSSLIAVEGRVEGLAVEGFMTLPSAARPRPRTQLVFVNERLVKDRSLIAAVRTGCKDFLPGSLQPAFVLSLSMDPARVDVNVHPTKAEVRFRDRDAIFRLVRRACRDALLAADLSPRVTAEAFGSTSAPSAPKSFGLPPGSPPPSSRSSGRAGAIQPTQPTAHPGGLQPEHVAEAPDVLWPATPHGPAPATPAVPAPAPRAVQQFLQSQNTYLLHDTPEGLVVIDQHALHERVLYSKLQKDLADGKLESQRLLMPETVKLSPIEHAQALEMRDELARFGLEVDDFGPDTVAIRAVPAVLRHEPLDDLLRALLDPPDLHGGIPNGLDRRLFTMACHAAVRAGDALSEPEAAAILEQGAALEHDDTCPHGRPTRLVITRDELDKLFKRTGF